MPLDILGLQYRAANTTLLYWNEVNRLIWVFLAPLILLFGIVGNILVLVLLSGTKRHPPTFYFFSALAVADFLNLTFGLLPTWYGWQYGIWFVDESKAACLFLKYVGYSLGMLSTLLLMLLTAHRALATVFPRRVDGCSKRQALLSIFLAAASVFIVNSYVLVFMDLVDNRCRWERQFYKNYAEVVNWVNAVLYSGLPFVVIACSNFVIAKAVRSSKLKQTPTPKDDAHACHRPVHAKVTFIITSVSMAFLILTLPSSVVRLVNVSMNKHSRVGVWSFAHEFALILWYMNCAVNFYLYMCTGPAFRSQGAKILQKTYFWLCTKDTRVRKRSPTTTTKENYADSSMKTFISPPAKASALHHQSVFD